MMHISYFNEANILMQVIILVTSQAISNPGCTSVSNKWCLVKKIRPTSVLNVITRYENGNWYV